MPGPYPTPNDNPHACPVCGMSPCSVKCRLGLQAWDVEDLRAELIDVDELLAVDPPTPAELKEWGRPVIYEEPGNGKAA